MIGPNLPQSNFRPPGPGADVTLVNPGFFESAAFPTFAPLMGAGGPLLSMMPMGLPLAGMGQAAPTEPGKKPSKKEAKKLQEMGAKMQKDYIQGVIGSFMQSSLELQANFSMYLGGGIPK